MNFEDILGEEYDRLDEVDAYNEEMFLIHATDEELKEWAEERGMSPEDLDAYLDETLVKHVSYRGDVSKTRTLKQRRRSASRTTGLSRAQLKRRARKAAKTRKRNPAAQKKAVKKRKKAMKKRKQRGL